MVENSLIQDQLKNLKKRKEILIILIFLFVIIIFWIGLSLFSSQQKLGITPEQKVLSQPLTPNVNTAVLEKLEAKKKYSDFELKEFPIYAIYQDGGENKIIDVSQGFIPNTTEQSTNIDEENITDEEATPEAEEEL